MYFQTLCVSSKGSGETADAQTCECLSLGPLSMPLVPHSEVMYSRCISKHVEIGPVKPNFLSVKKI